MRNGKRYRIKVKNAKNPFKSWIAFTGSEHNHGIWLVADRGARLFSKEEVKAENIREYIEENSLECEVEEVEGENRGKCTVVKTVSYPEFLLFS